MSAPERARLKILITAPHLDGHDVGESMTAYRLVEAMSREADITVLCLECTHGPPLAEQLPLAEVVTWPEPAWIRKNERMRALLKPNLFVLAAHVKRWIRGALAEGRRFDLAHQLLPRAPRYPTPLRHFPIPYVVGSLGGALPTPPGFAAEVATEKWYAKLRRVDPLRFAHDPWLRASYGGAEMVLGVAPYMREVLAAAPIRRFEPFLGIGLADLAPEVERTAEPGRLRMLHVGRAVRTKGLRDVVRAMGMLKDLPGVTLSSIGDGEEIAICRAEAERLGVADRVDFLGRLPRAEIEKHYEAADALVFPSFRESMGGVLYEAMRWGLPAITANVGGPGYIVDESCGLLVDARTPDQLAGDVAGAIRRLAENPAERLALGRGARAKMERDALWPAKAARMLALYEEIRTGAAR